jgi:hypothetical protein
MLVLVLVLVLVLARQAALARGVTRAGRRRPGST